jgi:hypothetical protein
MHWRPSRTVLVLASVFAAALLGVGAMDWAPSGSTGLSWHPALAQGETVVHVGPDVIRRDVKRLGINLGNPCCSACA